MALENVFVMLVVFSVGIAVGALWEREREREREPRELCFCGVDAEANVLDMPLDCYAIPSDSCYTVRL